MFSLKQSTILTESLRSSKESLISLPRKYHEIKRKYYDIKQIHLIFSQESNEVPNGVPYSLNNQVLDACASAIICITI